MNQLNGFCKRHRILKREIFKLFKARIDEQGFLLEQKKLFQMEADELRQIVIGINEYDRTCRATYKDKNLSNSAKLIYPIMMSHVWNTEIIAISDITIDQIVEVFGGTMSKNTIRDAIDLLSVNNYLAIIHPSSYLHSVYPIYLMFFHNSFDKYTRKLYDHLISIDAFNKIQLSDDTEEISRVTKNHDPLNEEISRVTKNHDPLNEENTPANEGLEMVLGIKSE